MHTNNRPVFLTWRICRAALVAFALSVVSPALAQQAPATIRLSTEDAERGLNGHQHNFDFLPPGENGNNYQSAGFFGQRLRPYLAGHAQALAELDRYRRQKTLFLVDRLIAVSAFGVYGQQIFANGEAQYFNSTQNVAIGVFATSVLATVVINRNTNNYLQHAVSSYNASVAHGGRWPRLKPAAVGLGASPTGYPVLALRWTVR